MLVVGGVILTPDLDGTGTGAAYDPETDTWTDLPIAPTTRLEHEAVWTGTQLIMFGGRTSLIGGSIAPGGSLFDGNWMTLPASSAPSDRWLHTVVWTGTEMIVWGGANDSSLVSGGSRFLPGAGSWSAVFADEFTPRDRVGHVAIWTGAEMIVWGGGSNDTPPESYQDGGRYDPASNRWARLTTVGAPAARSRPVSAWTGREMLVWGGGAGDTLTPVGGAYERAIDTWRAIPTENQPEPRFGATGIWTGDELIVWGGNVDSAGSAAGARNSGGRYVPPPAP